MTSVTDMNDNAPDALLDAAAEWLLRRRDAVGDAALEARFAAWLAADPAHADAYRRVERMWHVAGALPAEGTAPVAAKPVRRERRRAVVAAAMALAACLAVAVYPTMKLKLDADFHTDTGEVRDVRLADGSTVTLDAGSAIAVDFDAGRRDVKLLAGQAFFDVVKMSERPFSVTAGDVRAVVTGTKFAVRAGETAVTVALASGGVDVMRIGDDGAASVHLRPGERVRLAHAGGDIEKGGVAVAEIGAWRDNRLIVHAQPLADVIDDLDRHYRGMIVLRDPGLRGRRVTGNFDLDRPAEALAAAVAAQKGTVTRLTPYLLVVTGR